MSARPVVMASSKGENEWSGFSESVRNARATP